MNGELPPDISGLEWPYKISKDYLPFTNLNSPVFDQAEYDLIKEACQKGLVTNGLVGNAVPGMEKYGCLVDAPLASGVNSGTAFLVNQFNFSGAIDLPECRLKAIAGDGEIGYYDGISSSRLLYFTQPGSILNVDRNFSDIMDHIHVVIGLQPRTKIKDRNTQKINASNHAFRIYLDWLDADNHFFIEHSYEAVPWYRKDLAWNSFPTYPPGPFNQPGQEVKLLEGGTHSEGFITNVSPDYPLVCHVIKIYSVKSGTETLLKEYKKLSDFAHAFDVLSEDLNSDLPDGDECPLYLHACIQPISTPAGDRYRIGVWFHETVFGYTSSEFPSIHQDRSPTNLFHEFEEAVLKLFIDKGVSVSPVSLGSTQPRDGDKALNAGWLAKNPTPGDAASVIHTTDYVQRWNEGFYTVNYGGSNTGISGTFRHTPALIPIEEFYSQEYDTSQIGITWTEVDTLNGGSEIGIGAVNYSPESPLVGDIAVGKCFKATNTDSSFANPIFYETRRTYTGHKLSRKEGHYFSENDQDAQLSRKTAPPDFINSEQYADYVFGPYFDPNCTEPEFSNPQPFNYNGFAIYTGNESYRLDVTAAPGSWGAPFIGSYTLTYKSHLRCWAYCSSKTDLTNTLGGGSPYYLYRTGFMYPSIPSGYSVPPAGSSPDWQEPPALIKFQFFDIYFSPISQVWVTGISPPRPYLFDIRDLNRTIYPLTLATKAKVDQHDKRPWTLKHAEVAASISPLLFHNARTLLPDGSITHTHTDIHGTTLELTPL